MFDPPFPGTPLEVGWGHGDEDTRGCGFGGVDMVYGHALTIKLSSCTLGIYSREKMPVSTVTYCMAPFL